MKRNVTLIIILFALAIIAFIFSQTKHLYLGKNSCIDEIECLSIKSNEAIKIAVLQPLSGRLKNSGTVQIRGIELALKAYNSKLLGHPIELVIEDSGCSPEGGAVSALKIVADRSIIGIIGTNCSGAAAEASKIMSEAGLVMISGTNSASSLTSTDGIANSDWYPGYFRTMYNSIKRGEAGAIYAYKVLGLRRAATINDGDSRSKELTDIFEKTFIELGGQIVISTVIDRGDKDMTPVLKAISNKSPQIIFSPVFPPETNLLTNQLSKIKELSDTKFMVCGSTVRNQEFIDDVGEAGNGLLFVGKAPLDNEIFTKLENLYNGLYSDLDNDILYAFSFDATNILLEAIKKSSFKDRNGTLHIGRQRLRDNMYKTKNHNGATGVLSSDAFGDCGTPKFNILELKDFNLGYEGLVENEVFTYTPK